MKRVLLTWMLGCMGLLSLGAGKPTCFSAEIQGYQGKMVYFDFVEEGGINKEFPFKENQLMDFVVELNDVTTLKINTFVVVCLQPGDSLHARITYEGKSYRTVEYTGTPSAVALNSALHDIRMGRVTDRYKTNIPAALVTLVEPKGYHVATLEKWKEAVTILDGVKDQITSRMYNYVLSEQEGLLLSNLISYPHASASFGRKSVTDCIADGYWDALNDYKLRNDDASLRSRTYMMFLGPYKDYMKRKEAGNDTTRELTPITDLEKEYADLVDFYDGSLRDAALFVFLYDAIAGNKDFGVIEKLKKEYLKKYNKNKEYRKILAEILK